MLKFEMKIDESQERYLMKKDLKEKLEVSCCTRKHEGEINVFKQKWIQLIKFKTRKERWERRVKFDKE